MSALNSFRTLYFIICDKNFHICVLYKINYRSFSCLKTFLDTQQSNDPSKNIP